MRRMVQRRVEDTVAAMILRGEANPGDTITLDAGNLGGNAVATESDETPAPESAGPPTTPPAA